MLLMMETGLSLKGKITQLSNCLHHTTKNLL